MREGCGGVWGAENLEDFPSKRASIENEAFKGTVLHSFSMEFGLF